MNRVLDVNKIRADFPLINNSDIIYLDSAATAQKPDCVLNVEREFYEKYNANPFRGLYELSERATQQYENAREAVREFINAEDSAEIIFTRNATEGFNLAAYSLAPEIVKEGDEILVSIIEHHSNLLPWQGAAKRCGAELKYLECTSDGEITEELLREALTDRTRLFAVTHISNVIGRENDMKMITRVCHERGVIVVCDGAQSVPHIPVDVRALDVDFLSFSGHKMLAPMGIGVLYGKRELLEKTPPFLTGGEMIDSVSRSGAVYAELPHKFEAGTVNAAAAAALAEAIRYIKRIGFDRIQAYETELTALAVSKLQKIHGVRIIGSQDPYEHHGIVTFKLEGVHPHDVAAILDSDGIAVRAGHHCAQPLFRYMGIPSAARASLAFYNTEEEIIKFTESVGSIRRKMGYAE